MAGVGQNLLAADMRPQPESTPALRQPERWFQCEAKPSSRRCEPPFRSAGWVSVAPMDGSEPVTADRQFGMARAKVYPASKARQLLNPGRRLVQPPRRVVRQIGLEPSTLVLEVGPGSGYFSADLARAVPTGCVVLCDLQAEMLRIARDRTDTLANIVAVQADACALPYHAASFDAVLLVAVLGEIPDQLAFLRALARVLKPGATVTVAETRRDSDFIALARLRSMFEGAGYRMIDRHGIGWEYVARFRTA